MHKIDLLSFSMTLGGIWAFIVFVFGIYSERTGKGKNIIDMASTLYFGYKPGILGGFFGAFWGFLDGAISGVIIGFLYNKITGAF